MVETFVNIDGYYVTEEIYNSSRTVVYRVYREIDSLPVLIKVLKTLIGVSVNSCHSGTNTQLLKISTRL